MTYVGSVDVVDFDPRFPSGATPLPDPAPHGASGRPGHGRASVHPVQEWVVDGEGGVVLLQDVGRRPLDAEFAQGEGPALAIGRSDHLYEVLGTRLVPELQQQKRQVVEEQQAVQQTGGVLDDVPVLDLSSLLVQADTIEQPEAQEEDKQQEGEEGAEQVDPGQTGARRAVEHGPGAHSQDQQLEGERDEEAVTVNLALELRVPWIHIISGEIFN